MYFYVYADHVRQKLCGPSKMMKNPFLKRAHCDDSSEHIDAFILLHVLNIYVCTSALILLIKMYNFINYMKKTHNEN